MLSHIIALIELRKTHNLQPLYKVLPPCPYPSIMNSEQSGSHGWHTGFAACIWSWLLALKDEANGQRDSIQKNTEDGIDEIIGQEQIYYDTSCRIMRP